jgi:deazaflavin-dependent oxidoreductase (nitroreductase family)
MAVSMVEISNSRRYKEDYMPIQRLPGGTRGARTPPPLLLTKVLMPIMQRIHRRTGDRFRGSDLLYLTTIGARTGQRRVNPVARFDDGKGGWFVVASFGGAARHPGWYHNIAAYPEQLWVEASGTTHRVDAEQLDGTAHDDAWAEITSQAPSFLEYADKTDRHIPVLRLTPSRPTRPHKQRG